MGLVCRARRTTSAAAVAHHHGCRQLQLGRGRGSRNRSSQRRAPDLGRRGLWCLETIETPLRLRIQFIRRRDAFDLTYEVQFCSDPSATASSGWEATRSPEKVTIIDQQWERVGVSDEAAPPGTSVRFGRVVIRK
jgi:hypothetical protein